MKNEEIIALGNTAGIEKLKYLTFKKSINTVNFAREFKKFVEKFNIINEEFNALRNSLIEKYGEKGEDDNFFIKNDSENIKNFMDELDEYGKEEFDFTIKKFNVEDIEDSAYTTKEELKDKKLTVQDFINLDVFFNYEEEAVVPDEVV
jgi:hypothetical protein